MWNIIPSSLVSITLMDGAKRSFNAVTGDHFLKYGVT
tara:strand:+ start:1534 stop:1644 length:111 start_codon:yes stop_codon:yes gene_type:complete